MFDFLSSSGGDDRAVIEQCDVASTAQGRSSIVKLPDCSSMSVGESSAFNHPKCCKVEVGTQCPSANVMSKQFQYTKVNDTMGPIPVMGTMSGWLGNKSYAMCDRPSDYETEREEYNKNKDWPVTIGDALKKSKTLRSLNVDTVALKRVSSDASYMNEDGSRKRISMNKEAWRDILTRYSNSFQDIPNDKIEKILDELGPASLFTPLNIAIAVGVLLLIFLIMRKSGKKKGRYTRR